MTTLPEMYREYQDSEIARLVSNIQHAAADLSENSKTEAALDIARDAAVLATRLAKKGMIVELDASR